MPLKLTNLTD